MSTADKQRFASIARQIGAGLVSVYGILSLKDVAPHLPTWVAGVMVAVGPAFQLLEHWLGDPSTGTSPAPAAALPTVVASAGLQVIDGFVHGVQPQPVPTVPAESAEIVNQPPPAPTPQGA